MPQGKLWLEHYGRGRDGQVKVKVKPFFHIWACPLSVWGGNLVIWVSDTSILWKKVHLPCFCIFSPMVGHTCAPSFLLNLPSIFCYLLLPNKLPQHLVAQGSDFLFSQLWVGRSPLGLAGLTPVAALSSRWGREGRESLTPMLRVSVLAGLLHVASHPPGGQIWLLHSAMASGFPEL